ncbi:2-succinyl-6-hydroxy-2,4-cyclohexadiene-1-carboxylate synthase [Puniceicoccus vermicola]|uniref:2-succinyl-6-hydroxy-2,4-cyclohexadiene-1-carboxylate synthase n=1 Tax=Puniceicoccus vermicola TaxID=388746 RepID=A0A7X1AZW7_9BACT|nr:2-succinyl-6-hydroxy-2,4-cyclohexadiene-1-carboxylate synthase [Puniceicoccus vermicola]MBC2603046.1 2-succinyl-6-hydroxy-2,4-cyclohexadiene-1-carboxylate synthase [Puniceicoccus vermicola]
MSQLLSSATRILALHGFTGEGADYSALSSCVGGSWTCPDLPGHGIHADAPAEDFRWEALENQLLNLSGSPQIGIGYSMGGRLLLHLAIRNQSAFEKLVLISTSPGLPTLQERKDRRRADKRWIDLLHQEGISSFLDQWWKQPVLQTLDQLPAPKRDALLERRRQNKAQGLIHSLEHHGTGALPSLWDKLINIKIPTLICVGETDSKFNQIASEMSDRLQNSHLSIVPHAGHSPHLENPEDLASAILRFLK